MAKQLKYYSEFISVEGLRWRVEILEETDGVELIAQEVYLPPDPLTIEWSSTKKHDVVECSSATLTLESDTDRRFLDLYKVEVGAVLLKVYREGALYWSGTLDTELYEEPYAYNANYDVTLAFSDFAPLERLKWERTGFISKHDVVIEALKRAGIQYTALEKHISTLTGSAYNTPVTLTELYDLCENYYDEDGEAMTTLEVLKESLKPLCLRIKQKGGRIYIYDINALTTHRAEIVEWDGTDATLSTQEAYNNVTVNFSPYADTTIIDTKQDPDTTATDCRTGRMVHTDYANDGWKYLSPEGFSFFAGEKGGDNITIGNGAKFYRIDPEYSGNSEAGVAYTAWTFNVVQNQYQLLFDLTPAHKVSADSKTIITTSPRFVTSLSDYYGYKLKVSLDVLFDVRYNPFEQAHLENEEGNWQRLKDWANFAYVPVKIYIKDEQGTILYHYYNNDVAQSNGYKNTGRWVAGAPSMNSCWLCFYDRSNRRSSSGLGGWQTNKPIIGYHQGGLPSAFDVMGDGENIPLPPVSGYLTIEVLSGVWQFDYDRTTVTNLYGFTRWLLYKDLEVKVIKTNGRNYEPEDIEIKAWINRAAKEDLQIDTISGTLTKPIPSARGAIFSASLQQAERFRRGGTMDTLERLLINTMYSNYAQRDNILSGTVCLLEGFGVYADSNTEGTYMITQETQHPYNDTSEIAMVEIHEDNYTGIEYVEQI